MQIVFAAFTVVGGVVAVLAGAYGLRQTRRIAARGHDAVAVVKPVPPGAERPLLTYETREGRVMEIPSPVTLPQGSIVSLRYDPDDPREVVVDGHHRTGIDIGFTAGGLALAAVGVTLIAWGL
ncbi:DUF3592 domain-containing protein [Streptomyces sp. NPDC057638]|uniref:DUF3592 domain-containing protein n=1 Tax=Streptomyces sp. NPDC057638 TaxID=3346190 RepID=UPI0036AB592C